MICEGEPVITVDDDVEIVEIDDNVSSVNSHGRNENDISDGGKAEADLSKSAYIEYLLSNVNNPSVGKIQVNSCQETDMSRSMYSKNIEISKPPYSYKELILKVFDLVKLKPLDLRDIYFLITATFPYYKPGGAWQSAVRHVLFSDPTFVAEPETNLWRINPIVTFQNKHFGSNIQSKNDQSYQFSYPCHEFYSYKCSVKDTCQDAVLDCRTNFNYTKTSYASLDVRKPNFDYVFSNQHNVFSKIENQPYRPPVTGESLNECNICASLNNGNNSSHRYHTNEIFRNSYSNVCNNMCQQNVNNYTQRASSSWTFADCDSPLNSGLSLSLANTLMNLSFESFIPTISSTCSKPISTLSEISAQCNTGANEIQQQRVQELYSTFANNDSQDSGKVLTNSQTKVYDELDCCSPMDFIDSSEPTDEISASSESSTSFQTCLNETNNLTEVDSSCSFADLPNDSNSTKSDDNLNTDSPFVNSAQPKIHIDLQIPIYGPVSIREAKSSFLNSSNKSETVVGNGQLNHQIYTVNNNTTEVTALVNSSFYSLKESVEKSNRCKNVTSNFNGSISTTNTTMQIEDGSLKESVEKANRCNNITSNFYGSITTSMQIEGDSLKESVEKSNHCNNITSNFYGSITTSMQIEGDSLKESVEKSNHCNNITSNFDGSINTTNTTMQIEDGSLKESVEKANRCNNITSNFYGSINTSMQIEGDSLKESVEKSNHCNNVTSNCDGSINTNTTMQIEYDSLKESIEKSSHCNNVTSNFDGIISTNSSMQIENDSLKMMMDLSATNKSTDAYCISLIVDRTNVDSEISKSVLNETNKLIKMDLQSCTLVDLSENSNTTKLNENLIADSYVIKSIQSKNCMDTKVPVSGLISARETKSSTSNSNSESEFAVENNKLNSRIYTNSNNDLEVSVNTTFSSQKESVEESNDLSNVTLQCDTPIIINTSIQSEDDDINISKLSSNNKSSDVDCVSQTVERSKADWEISLMNIDIHLSALENLKELHSTFSMPVIETATSQMFPPGVFSNKGIECNTNNKSCGSSSLPVGSKNYSHDLKYIECSAEMKECRALFKEVSAEGGSSEISDSDEIKSDGGGIIGLASCSKSQTGNDNSVSSFPSSPDDVPAEQATKSQKKRRNVGPTRIRGFSKPSGSYCQMITQALALCPNKRATALQICELIANKHDYYRHYTGSWQGSIYSALTNRKKFFMIADMTSSGEYIWGFNPMFEKYIIDKWLPTKMKKNICMTPTTVTTPLLSQASPDMSVIRPVTTTMSSVITETVILSDNEETLTPVIVSTESLRTESEALEPEFTLADPDLQDITTIDGWGPMITVSADASDGDDFCVSNWKINNVISYEEKAYRVSFQKEHTNVIEKFRLHCTVCDCHLGSKASEAKERVRLHSRLGVLTCVQCYILTQAITKAPSCFWCRRCDEETHFYCSSCHANFCDNCLKRNFGHSWWKINFKKTKNWLCFLCNNKQIWPHRAIAHCLLRHYSQLTCLKKLMKSGTKNDIANSDETQFFDEDKSNCCKETTEKSGELSSESSINLGLGAQVLPPGSPLAENKNTQINNDPGPPIGSPQDVNSRINNKSDFTPRLSKPQVFIVEKQQPGHIYVQASVGGPSVTLNTGTQYIHNVYPDKNYVLVQPPNLNRLTSESIPNMMSSLPQTQSAGNPVLESSYSPSSLNRSNFTNYHTAKYTPPTFVDCSAPPQTSNKLVKTETVSTPDQVKGSVKNFLQSPTIQNIHILPGGMLVTNRIDESGDMIVPDQPQELISHEQEPLQEISIREKLKEKIQSRPMPKSKKQSLLRAVLMSESIESMKKTVANC
ncbi:uncharacterized protein LOC124363070 isoform X1 [Homalodisca vitripennis]|uniref:uncharacterized protein LOC124363070 isoform X1 n=1 Tax=Homalodisca vitripennis TaxID=197043 RepID=UPI001EE9D0EE|nr:uncharacterized protein LOC124363070 isoform X1 [Homalodisca vitripennis]